MILNKHTDVFREELGLLREATAKINIQSGATTKFSKAYTVSYFLREKVEKEIQRLQLRSIKESFCQSLSRTGQH